MKANTGTSTPIPFSRVGIVGGGQLARMLVQAGGPYQIPMTVLDPDPHSPAAQCGASSLVGALHDPESLHALCAVSDVVTFDLENVGADILMNLENQGVTIIPRPSVVVLIQNKLHQKQHYAACGIATSRFEALPEDADFQVVERFGLPLVQKAEVGGYDGRGVHIIRNRDDWAIRLAGPSFIEAYVPDALELAVMVARSATGEMIAYDPVEMVVDPALHLLDYLLAPARIAPALAGEATQLALRTVGSFDSPGLFGVEMFLTPEGQLLVNEVAPRAHNSGHHSIEACVTSQFENQLRACLGLPLGDTALRGCALTKNLVGEPGFVGTPCVEGLDELLAEPDVHLHLYGKAACRGGRKMGHITCVGATHAEVLETFSRVRDRIKIRGVTSQ